MLQLVITIECPQAAARHDLHEHLDMLQHHIKHSFILHPFVIMIDMLACMQGSQLLSQKSLRWRRALSPRKSSLQEDWVLRGLTLHQLKDIITDIYASKAKADLRYMALIAYA